MTRVCQLLAQNDILEEKLQKLQLKMLSAANTIKSADIYLGTLTYNLMMRLHESEEFLKMLEKNEGTILELLATRRDPRAITAVLCLSFDRAN